MNRTRMIKQYKEYIHIDNGGISFVIKDAGPSQGIIFETSADYYGYPSIKSSMRIDGSISVEEYLTKLESLIKSVRKDIRGIDWEKRYNE